MLHIFLLFGCMPTPVKYYGSCFSSPITSTIIGILGTLVAGCPAVAGLLCLTSSNALSNPHEPSTETPATPTIRTPTQRAGLWACRPLPTHFPTLTSRQAQNSSPPNQPHIPRFRPDLCPPSSDRARPEAPHNPTRPTKQANTCKSVKI